MATTRTTGPVTTTIWHVGDDGIVRRVTTGGRVADPACSGPTTHRPTPAARAAVEWPPGRYVFDVEGAGPRDSHWFAVEVVRFVVDSLAVAGTAGRPPGRDRPAVERAATMTRPWILD